MRRAQTFWKFGFSLLLLALTHCSNDTPSRNTLYAHHADDLKSLDPAIAYDRFSWEIMPQIYETLYQYHYLSDPITIQPLLAADFPKISKDGKTLTIRLLRGIRFQADPALPSTRELQAQDFIYAFKRLALPSLASPGAWIFDEKIVGFSKFKQSLASASEKDLPKKFAAKIPGFHAPNPSTLVIKLTQPYPQILHLLTLPFTSPIAREVVERYADAKGALHEKPIGTGPFILKSWIKGHQIILERNSRYHASFYPTQASKELEKKGFLTDAGKTIPLLNRIIFQVIRESQPAWLAFINRDLDYLAIPKDNFSQAIVNQIQLSPELKKENIKLNIQADPSIFYLSFNMKNKTLGTNKKLRQAISSAIDRQTFIDLFHNGRGTPAQTILPPSIEDRPKKPKLRYDFDLARSKRLLAQAGYPDGEGLGSLKLEMRGSDSINRQMGEFFHQQLKKIGIRLEIVYNSFPRFLEKQKSHDFQILFGGWTLDYPDAENAYQLLYGPNQSPGPNESAFDHKEMNSLYKKLVLTTPGPARQKIIEKMDEIFQEQVPWALIFHPTSYTLSHPWLKNFRPHPMILNRYKYYRIDWEKRAVDKRSK